MSFLGRSLAGKEAAYFFQESKQAVGKLAQKNPLPSKPNNLDSVEHELLGGGGGGGSGGNADVLPEVLRHSLPSKIFRDETANSTNSSFSASKWVLHSDPKIQSFVNPDAINPLRAYVSLPQVTFGPKRWELPKAESTISASTANDLRQDRQTTHVNPEKLKAAAEGLANVGKAFAIATAVVFGGAALVFGTVASKLDMHNASDIKTKGKDFVEPQLESIKERFVPMKTWAENMSRKWHLKREEDAKQNPLAKELARMWGAKTSD
ncbi:uncharacterized protein LOC107496776 [Arachis duranensis]|uniref:Uncharacterized protein LOC107496776 n=1 Tax=Arachis duranensis TaxID=130453 RepID=A0A6P4DX25_ARADU|nr:uncharacterized protein LOC107496776 [Arachis duranensis]